MDDKMDLKGPLGRLEKTWKDLIMQDMEDRGEIWEAAIDRERCTELQMVYPF
jgi:hypothetical protein